MAKLRALKLRKIETYNKFLKVYNFCRFGKLQNYYNSACACVVK